MSHRFSRKRPLLVVLLVLTIALQAALPARAQEPPVESAQTNVAYSINVTTLVDEWSTDTNTKAQSKCSLREALQATVSGNPQGNQGCGSPAIANFDEYYIIPLPGTYLLSLPDQLPNITKKITIEGKKSVTIDGNSKSNRAEGIFIVGGGQLNLSEMTLQNGWRPFGGALWIKSGGASVEKVKFYRNRADNGSGNGDGGAVAVDTGKFSALESKFEENSAANAGGAISSGGVEVRIDRSDFFRNHAEINGGAYAGYGGSGLTFPLIRESKFRENWIYQTNTPANWPAQYQYGDDKSGGGAIYNKGYMELEKVQLFKNYTQRSKGGGAIYNQGEMRTLDSAISDNKARPDGPVPNTLGGAILNDGDFLMRRTSIHENEAVLGGGVMNRTGGRMYVVNSTIADNLAKIDGGLANGFNFSYNGNQYTNNGNEVIIWQSTLARAKDNNTDSANVSNPGLGYIRMANSVTDSICTGTINSQGSNIFYKSCTRVADNNGNDQTATDLIANSIGQIGLQGLANNGGPSLPEAEFLSIKPGNPAVDRSQDAYCTDPALELIYRLNIDQAGAKRPVGPKCDSGALEVGTFPPDWDSDKPEGAGFFFPLTIFGKKWSSEQTLLISNKGGGLIDWSVEIENSAGGVFSQIGGPKSGVLANAQETLLEFRCAPTEMGAHDGVILFKTDNKDQPQIRYPVTCNMRGNPDDPAAWRNHAPGPMSSGQTPAGGQSSVQVQVGNQGANPMAATLNFKDLLADTIKFVVNLGNVTAAAGPQTDITVPSGGVMTIDITCTPVAPGLYSNTLQITTNDPFNPVMNYDISCEGTPAPDPETMTPASLSSEVPSRQIMGMALSPDGKQLLAGHWENNEIANYSILNANTGLLSLQNKFSTAGMNTITGIRYSSDGKNVYYSSFGGNGVVAVNRDANGNLTFLQSLTKTTTNSMGGARALDISPDDMNVYVTGVNDDTLTVLARKADGTLEMIQQIPKTVDGLVLLDGPFGVLVSPDGKNVYVAGSVSDTVVAFERDSVTGKLRYLTHAKDEENGATGLNGALEFAISPDGRFLYVTSRDDDAIQILQRNPADGFITPQEVVTLNNSSADPYHALISHDPEGSRMLVAQWNGNAINVYHRDWVTGKISPLAGQANLTMNGPVFLVGTEDDRHVYAALFDGKGVQQLRNLNFVPIAENLSPASAVAGSGDLLLTINGSRFYAHSAVLWNGAPLTTNFVSSRKLTAVVPAAQLAGVGAATVLVRTNPPGGGDSSTLSFAIIGADEPPTPSVTSISPPAALHGGEPLNIVVSGAGFTLQSQALLNGVAVDTIFINANTLLVQLAASDVGTPGPLFITVVNSALSVSANNQQTTAVQNSAPVVFSIAPPNSPALAAISSFQPASLKAGSGEQWLTLRGHNFSLFDGAQSTARWNGEERESSVQDAQTMLIKLSAADLASAGQAAVTVYTPGVGESDPAYFTLYPDGQNPTAQVDSAYAESGENVQLVVSGSDFVDGAQVLINGSARATVLINPYVLSATVSYNDLLLGGVVTVVNPGTAPSSGLVLAPYQIQYLPLIAR